MSQYFSQQYLQCWTNFKLTCWTDEREFYWLGGCDLYMSFPFPGNLSKTCTAEGWTEMHPIDIALNCGYNLNSTSDDVSKLLQSIRGIRTDTHRPCSEWTQQHSGKPTQEPVGRKNWMRTSFLFSVGGCCWAQSGKWVYWLLVSWLAFVLFNQICGCFFLWIASSIKVHNTTECTD